MRMGRRKKSALPHQFSTQDSMIHLMESAEGDGNQGGQTSGAALQPWLTATQAAATISPSLRVVLPPRPHKRTKWAGQYRLFFLQFCSSFLFSFFCFYFCLFRFQFLFFLLFFHTFFFIFSKTELV